MHATEKDAWGMGSVWKRLLISEESQEPSTKQMNG